jgi:hypothetical protein
MHRYLQARIDMPLAWVVTFACSGALAGLVSGLAQNGGLSEIALLALVGGVVGAVLGLPMGIAVWGVRRFGSRLFGGLLDRPLRRPEMWAMPLACTRCEWRCTAEGPWRIRDCCWPPKSCPSCGQGLAMLRIPCPDCGTIQEGKPRIPRNRRQALWGGNTCEKCGCSYDKWGRRVMDE